MKPDIEPILTMAPRRRSIMRLPKERLHQKTPLRLTSLTLSQSSSGTSSPGVPGAGDAGIGDEDVGGAVALDDVGGGLLDLFRLGHVHDDDIGALARFLHLGAALLGDGAIEIGDHHLGAGLGERLAAGEADGAAAAGHHRDAAVEPEAFPDT